MDLPVSKGYHLKFARTGSHFANYDTLISMVRFKAHYLDFYGGTLKNLSICMGTGVEGKCLVHSAGEVMDYFSSRDDKTTCEAMSDAVKAAMEAKQGRWVFINVIDAFEPEDSCEGIKNLGNIGMLAGFDPVAVDQAAIDMTFGAAPNAQVRAQWEERHSTMLTAIAASHFQVFLRGIARRIAIIFNEGGLCMISQGFNKFWIQMWAARRLKRHFDADFSDTLLTQRIVEANQSCSVDSRHKIDGGRLCVSHAVRKRITKGGV